MGRSLLNISRRKKVRSTRIPIGLDIRHMGQEPEISGTLVAGPVLTNALNWYNYFGNPKQNRRHIMEYLEAAERYVDVGRLGNVPDKVLGGVSGAMCRMLSRGAQFEPDVMSRFESRLENLLSYNESDADAVSVTDDGTVVVIPRRRGQPKTEEVVGSYFAEFEEKIDEFSRNRYVQPAEGAFSAHEFLKEREAKPVVAAELARRYQRYVDELQSYIDRSDAQVIEAYKNIGKKKVRALLNFVTTIVGDCRTWADSRKKERVTKIRARRPKSADQLVRRVKYLREDADLKIRSVDASQVIGARVLYAFNVKYRTLSRYIAEAGDGLSFRGTTLKNWAVDESSQKRLRKPGDVVPNICTGGPKAVDKVYDGVATKATRCNGRINGHVLLLRVLR